MHSITVRNVNHALPLALALLRDTGRPVAPRGMATTEIPGPFATTYEWPVEMVLFDPVRDANPFFHLFESLWVLAGRSDVQFLAWFLPRMADFSDDGVQFHAPYGQRLRSAFGLDQIEFCIKALAEDHATRQAVMSIWHPDLDWKKTKDKPCNDMVMFKIRDGQLRMTVSNRSNDAVLGAYGANVVQFSTLLKYVAGRVGIAVGQYTQVSDSFHVYEDNPYWKAFLAANPRGGVSPVVDPYESMTISESTHGWRRDGAEGPCEFMPPNELGNGAFDEDLARFFSLWDIDSSPSSNLLNERNYETDSFVHTILPMLQALINWRAGKRDEALEVAGFTHALDWRLAAIGWMNRRINKA